MAGKLTLTIGLPGSGKSTWAREQPDVLVLERDMIREMLTGNRRDHSMEGRVTAVHQELVEIALREGLHVIVSDTNLRLKHRREWRALVEGAEYEEVSFLDVPVETCIERDALRPDPVGAEVIKRMAERAGVK